MRAKGVHPAANLLCNHMCCDWNWQNTLWKKIILSVSNCTYHAHTVTLWKEIWECKTKRSLRGECTADTAKFSQTNFANQKYICKLYLGNLYLPLFAICICEVGARTQKMQLAHASCVSTLLLARPVLHRLTTCTPKITK